MELEVPQEMNQSETVPRAEEIAPCVDHVLRFDHSFTMDCCRPKNVGHNLFKS